jgi:hypothetical protein
MKLSKLIILISLLLISCQREIGECEIKEIDVYAISIGISFPIRTSEKDMRNEGLRERITSKEKINEFTKIINLLKKIEGNYLEMDVRIVIDMKCKTIGKSTILANRNLVKIGNEFYKPSGEFFELVGE